MEEDGEDGLGRLPSPEAPEAVLECALSFGVHATSRESLSCSEASVPSAGLLQG